MEKPRYLEQWNRVLRWHSRLKDFDSFNHDVNSETPLDYVYAFFLNCFHLKDWIKKELPTENKDEVEALYDREKGSVCLKICADIANASKHVKLRTETSRSNDYSTSILTVLATQNFKIGKPRTPTPPKPGIRWSFLISFEGKDHDAYEVADQCVKELENYLKTIAGT